MRQPFYVGLEAYWQSVREWTDFVIGQLKQKFEVYAESYRAQAEQALGGKELTKDQLDGLEEDLARLKPPVEVGSELRGLNSTRRANLAQASSKTM